MRKIFKNIAHLLFIAPVICGCSFFGKAEKDTYKVKLDLNSVVLEPGQTQKLWLIDAQGAIEWRSSDENVVIYDSGTTIKAVNEGRATITVKDLTNNTEASCNVNVRYPSIEPIDPINIATIAHKGYHQEAIENTKEAFFEAGRRNFYGIETDIHRTKDGKWICNHDNRVKGMSKDIADSTFDEIMAVNLSDDPTKVVKVCTFTEYVDVCSLYNKHPVIEFKTSYNSEIVQEILEILKTKEVLNEVIFISKQSAVLGTLYNLREQNGYTFDLQMLTEGNGWSYVTNILNVSSQYEAITADMVQSCNSYGQYVAAWTVNNRNDALNLINFGVKYITTDIFECASQFIDSTLFDK